MGILSYFTKSPCQGEFDRSRYEGRSPNEMQGKREEQRIMGQGGLQTSWEEQQGVFRQPLEQPVEELSPQGWWQRFLTSLFPFRD